MTSPLPGFDPAGLKALHVLLEERHVTRAARRLGITQSSMSHRLKGLRAMFGDELLVRTNGVLAPTPRARELAVPLREAMDALERVVTRPQPFDPRTSRRVFSLAMPDLLAPMLPALVASVSRASPGVSLKVSPLPPALGHALGTGHPELAFAALRDVPDSIRQRGLGVVRFGVACRRGHPLTRGVLTTERWLACRHIVVQSGNETPNVVAVDLSARGLSRQIGLEVPTFMSGLLAAAGSELVMNVPLILHAGLAATLGLTVMEAPVALPSVPAAMVWHERFHADDGHVWVRQLLYETLERALERTPVRERLPRRRGS